MRTYSEREVAAIIERAVERQQEADTGTPDTGLTLDEIERLGRESGIDPAHLRAAASEIDTEGRTLSRQTGQTRTEVVVERWIDVPLALEAWEDIVAHLRTEFGASAGEVLGQGDTIRQVGSSYEWGHTNAMGIRTRVVLSPRDGKTRLRMNQLVGMSSPMVEGIGYGSVIALLIGVMAMGAASGLTDGVMAPGVTGLTAFLVSWVAASFGVAAFDRRWRAKKLRQLDALADEIVPLVQRHADAEQSAQASEGADGITDSQGPLLDLDPLAESAVGPTDASRETRRVRS